MMSATLNVGLTAARPEVAFASVSVAGAGPETRYQPALARVYAMPMMIRIFAGSTSRSASRSATRPASTSRVAELSTARELVGGADSRIVSHRPPERRRDRAHHRATVAPAF